MQARALRQILLRSIPVFLMLVPAGARAQSATCHQATLKGQYVLHSTGTMAGNNFAAVGKEFYDGQGNFQLTGTASFNGTIYRGLSGTGTYTVNPDCTGSQTFGSGPTESHFDFVVTPDGRKITYIQTDTGDVITATAVRLNGAGD